jgi:alpha-N-arabinofuranosidase
LTETLPATSDTDYNSTLGYAYWVTGYSTESQSNIAKFAVYNTTDSLDIPFSINFANSSSKASLTYLTAPGPYSSNSVPNDNVVITTTKEITAGGNGDFEFELPQWSVAVLQTN